MSDIEDRLRAGLVELADGVPRSRDARVELDRRLAGGRPRHFRPLLVAAAAVVVAVVVPVVVFGGADLTAPPAASSGQPDPPPPSLSPSSSGRNDPSVSPTGPFEVGRYAEGRVEVYVEDDRFCRRKVPDQDPRSAQPSCEPLPVWPEAPTGSLVTTRPVLGENAPAGGPLPHLLVFLTDPKVTSLTVRRGDGAEVRVTELGRTDRAVVFLADFAGSAESYWGFGYTARDASGAVVENAIT